MIEDNKIRIVVEGPTLHYYRTTQTDVINESVLEPGNEAEVHRDFVIESVVPNVPTATANLLAITTNVGSAIVDDVYNAVADPTDTKYFKVCVARDDATTDLEIFVFTKTTGEYGLTPAGKTIEVDVKEFSLVAAGTALAEV